jgi:hypothetical protein
MTLDMVKNSMLNEEVDIRKKVMPHHLMLMWLNLIARMKPVDIAQKDAAK